MIQLTQTPKEKRDFELDDSGVLKKLDLKVIWKDLGELAGEGSPSLPLVF